MHITNAIPIFPPLIAATLRAAHADLKTALLAARERMIDFAQRDITVTTASLPTKQTLKDLYQALVLFMTRRDFIKILSSAATKATLGLGFSLPPLANAPADPLLAEIQYLNTETQALPDLMYRFLLGPKDIRGEFYTILYTLSEYNTDNDVSQLLKYIQTLPLHPSITRICTAIRTNDLTGLKRKDYIQAVIIHNWLAQDTVPANPRLAAFVTRHLLPRTGLGPGDLKALDLVLEHCEALSDPRTARREAQPKPALQTLSVHDPIGDHRLCTRGGAENPLEHYLATKLGDEAPRPEEHRD